MKEFTYTITDPIGFHARPAGLLVKKVKEYACEIIISCDGKSSSAKKLFGIMGMGIKNGQTVTVTVEGEDEENVAAELETFFKENA